MNGLPVVEEILERDHKKKGAAERGYRNVRGVYVFPVEHRIEERQFRNCERRETCRCCNNEYRKDKARTEHRERDSPHEKKPLPALAHSRENFCIYDCIVERERRP